MKTSLVVILFFIQFNFQYSLPFFSREIKNENTTEKKTIYIFGHKSPDTDTISSSIVLTDYLKRLGNSNNIIPCRLGELNKETKYVLDYFKVESPKLITNVSGADEVILVDHNEPSQSIDSENSNYVGLVDHHAITNLVTANPIKIITDEVGCTCTIIYELYRENNITIPKHIAGLMLSAIISDTLLLKSTTTTNVDIITAKNLSELIGINYTKYGYDMLLAGTDASDYSEYDIITTDSKAYTINGYPIEIATIKSVNTTEILVRKKKLLEEIDKYIINKKKELFIFTIVDIINIDTYLFARGNLSSSVEKAFGIKLEDSQLFLKGKNSRKKDIYPPIAKVINELPEYRNSSSESSSSNNESFDKYSHKVNLLKNIKLNYLLVCTLLLL